MRAAGNNTLLLREGTTWMVMVPFALSVCRWISSSGNSFPSVIRRCRSFSSASLPLEISSRMNTWGQTQPDPAAWPCACTALPETWEINGPHKLIPSSPNCGSFPIICQENSLSKLSVQLQRLKAWSQIVSKRHFQGVLKKHNSRKSDMKAQDSLGTEQLFSQLNHFGCIL